MSISVLIEVRDDLDGGYSIPDISNPRGWVQSAREDGGVWLGDDAFIPWGEITGFWFSADSEDNG